jgi:hypothetical protein
MEVSILSTLAILLTSGGLAWLIVQRRMMAQIHVAQTRADLLTKQVSFLEQELQELRTRPTASGTEESSSSPALSPSGPASETDERPDLLRNAPWLKLVEECVELVDELDHQQEKLDPPRRDLADHMMCRLQEILERAGVQTIVDEPVFDRRRHQPARAGSRAEPGLPIAETLSPGFAVGIRILRRARVQIANT